LSYAWDEIETFARLTPNLSGVKPYRKALAKLTAQANERLFGLVEESSLAFEQGDRSMLDPDGIAAYCQRMQTRLVDLRNLFVADNLDPLTDCINADCTSGPVLRPQIH
jgi:hypothetical protein